MALPLHKQYPEMNLKLLLTLLLCLSMGYGVSYGQRYPNVRAEGNRNNADMPEPTPGMEPYIKKTDSTELQRINHRTVKGGSFSPGGSLPNFFYFQIEPALGYMVKPWLTVGPGASYIFFRIRTPLPSGAVQKDNFNFYGGKLFAEIAPFWNNDKIDVAFLEGLMVHLEYDALNCPDLTLRNQQNLLVPPRKWVGSPVAGLGLRSHLGRKGFSAINVLYYFNYEQNQAYIPYNDIIIKATLFF